MDEVIVNRTKLLGLQFGDELGARKSPVLDFSKEESVYLCAHNEFCEMLSKCKYEYAEERSEGSRLKYVNLALKEYNEDEDEDYPYELVKPGPLALGSLPKGGGLILHLNFEAKLINQPDAPVLTFFCEFIKTNEGVVSVESLMSLGPTKLLPEKPDTYGCLYCCSLNIHHPEQMFSFLRGWKYRRDYLPSVVAKIDKYILACKERNLIPTSFHPAVKFITNLGDDSKATLANEALRTFNEKEGKEFELVKVRCCGLAVLSTGFLHHINFEAKDKNKNDPADDAPVQMFFAEVIYRYPTVIADCCISLGSSTSLPDEADMCGCLYCHSSPVHHPSIPGYITGREKYLQQ